MKQATVAPPKPDLNRRTMAAPGARHAALLVFLEAHLCLLQALSKDTVAPAERGARSLAVLVHRRYVYP